LGSKHQSLHQRYPTSTRGAYFWYCHLCFFFPPRFFSRQRWTFSPAPTHACRSRNASQALLRAQVLVKNIWSCRFLFFPAERAAPGEESLTRDRLTSTLLFFLFFPAERAAPGEESLTRDRLTSTLPTAREPLVTNFF